MLLWIIASTILLLVLVFIFTSLAIWIAMEDKKHLCPCCRQVYVLKKYDYYCPVCEEGSTVENHSKLLVIESHRP